ncbi:hypothetical protein M3O75_08830 [Klebsiella pneumoniae]|nr:hypothetical protein [Klebsiella pneumoniae]
MTTDAQATAYKLTPLGRQLSQLPVDPRLARMVLEAQKHGCVREAMIITSALSIQDPRERPMDKQQASDEKHRRFHDKESDFLAFVNLWNYLGEQQRRCRRISSAASAGSIFLTICACASGRTSTPSCARW